MKRLLMAGAIAVSAIASQTSLVASAAGQGSCVGYDACYSMVNAGGNVYGFTGNDSNLHDNYFGGTVQVGGNIGYAINMHPTYKVMCIYEFSGYGKPIMDYKRYGDGWGLSYQWGSSHRRHSSQSSC